MLSPRNEDELAEIVRSSQDPLAVQGGNTRGMAPEGIALTVTGLSGISLYEPGALTMVVKAGTTLAEVNDALQSENQRLAFEPMDYRGLLGTDGEPTIGGVVAANISGPRRVAVGSCRDFVLGVRFVTGSGQIIKNGGRVMKNVTGYDLVKLMAGSRGTLGILTEVSLKVLPQPETESTVILHSLDDRTAVKAMSKALGSPFEVTGAACLPSRDITVLRLEGFTESVRYRSQRLTDLLTEFGDAETTRNKEDSAEIWRGIRDAKSFHDHEGDVWRFSVKPSDGPNLTDRLETTELMYDWGGGLIWLKSGRGTNMRAQVGKFSGHATLVRADQETRDRIGMFQPALPSVAALSDGLRAQFEPRGILNAGLMTAA